MQFTPGIIFDTQVLFEKLRYNAFRPMPAQLRGLRFSGS
jgi:hypothetical protein